GLRGPLLSHLLHGTGRTITPVKNEQVLHLYEMHHGHGALTASNSEGLIKAGSKYQSKTGEE
ncbi:MAG: hypothetical protein ABSC55_26170, partial [Syntrophorhabdales bacterium]